MRHHQSGFTLIECLIAASLTLVVVASILSTVIFTFRTFVGIGNYAQINCQTRMAMDKMSRDIRQSAALTSGTSTSLIFTNFNGSQLQYQYNPSAQTLTYSNAATGEGGTLLKNCVSCTFSLFQFNPVPGSCMLFTNATTSSNCKVVEVNWICRITNNLSVNSEMMETTRIVLRN
jgi:Tfp pilus assembly protein PilW